MNQKYCSIGCREKNYEKQRKDYYAENKDKIRKQQKKYREKQKIKMMKKVKEYDLPLYVCKISTNIFKFNNPIKNYNYNKDYDLWTITTFDKDTFFIYSKNIKYLIITEYDEYENKKILCKCKMGKTEIKQEECQI